MKFLNLRNLKKAMAIMLTLVLLFVVCGCGGKSDSDGEWVESEIIVYEDVEEESEVETTESKVQSAESKVESTENKVNTESKTSSGSSQKVTDKNASPDKLSNPNITVFYPGTLDDHPEFLAINKAFEKKYGGKVTVVGDGNYDERGTRLTNLIQSKTQVDVVICMDEDFPSYPITKLVRPADFSKFDTTKGYFKDMDKSPIASYGGKDYFIVSSTGNEAGILCLYNKTLFENAGLETPLELYNKGEWNWETFRKAARTLSQDTNGDGSNDVYGFADYDINGLLCSNGTSLLTKNGDKYTVNFADEKVKKAYQLYFDMFNIDKSISGDPWGWSKAMTQGKLAMVFQESSLILTWKQENSKFEYDFVPLPKGPDASKVYRGGLSGGLALGATCKNPDGAYAYIKFYAEELAKKGFYGEKAGKTKFTADQEKRLKEYSNLKFNHYSPTGFGNLKMDARALLWEIRGGKSVGATIEYWKNVLQQDINVALMTK